MKHPRDIDMELVDAYLARRALDYLVGFTLSPVLWRKLPGARSAGRVQSVALRLIVDREIEIEALQDPGILDRRGRRRRRRRSVPGPAGQARGQAARPSSTWPTRPRPRPPRRRSRPASFTVARGGEEARPAHPRRRPSPPRPCSRRPRASSASRPSAPCRRRRSSTRASTSAARPSA